MAVFVLDSSFFIEAHRITYPLDIATGFWNKVQQLANAGAKNDILTNLKELKPTLYRNYSVWLPLPER